MYRLSLAALLLASLTVNAQDEAWYKKAVKGVEASFEPATARPGQTVTFRLAIELKDGYYTYPTAQADKKAASMVNKIEFPAAGAVIFVGDVKDPEKPDVKPVPELGIKALRTHSGRVVYERTAVVSPKAVVGEAAVELKSFRFNVCDKDNCYDPKPQKPAAKLTVKGEPMAVEKAWVAEVEKALAGK